MEEAVNEFIQYYSNRNLDSILRLIKSSLERIRKRVISNSQTVASYDQSLDIFKKKRSVPLFKCFACLAIPNIETQPSLDEIQMHLNKAINLIIGISKHILQWTKGRKVKKNDNIRRSTILPTETDEFEGIHQTGKR
jgi:hypothetical protein